LNSFYRTPNELHILRDASSSDLSAVQSRSKVSLLSPLSVPEAPREINLLKGQVDRSDSWYLYLIKFFYCKKKDEPKDIPAELSMTSRMSFFNDRIIQPEGIFKL
jgi:hypothetical protein